MTLGTLDDNQFLHDQLFNEKKERKKKEMTAIYYTELKLVLFDSIHKWKAYNIVTDESKEKHT